MSSLPRALAASLPDGVRQIMQRHVAFLRRDAGGWMLRHLAADQARPGQVTDAGDSEGPFDEILLAVPAPQAVPLLQAIGHPDAARVAQAVIAPCWAAMAAFAAPVQAADVLRPGGAIAWAARESSRPGRTPGGADAWVIHASPEWSRANLELAAPEAAARLLAEFTRLTGAPPPAYLAGHRWRHALVERALDVECLYDAEAGLGLCGDWCIGPRIEAAYDSGRALAAAVLRKGAA